MLDPKPDAKKAAPPLPNLKATPKKAAMVKDVTAAATAASKKVAAAAVAKEATAEKAAEQATTTMAKEATVASAAKQAAEAMAAAVLYLHIPTSNELMTVTLNVNSSCPIH
jgi:hypothetical protein